MKRREAAGIGALISLQAARIYLKLMNPTEPVSTVLRLTGLESMFEICEAESSEELLQHTTPERGEFVGVQRVAVAV